MAVMSNCPICGDPVASRAAEYGRRCRKCDGTEERERKEAERWAALTSDQKADELLQRVVALEQRSRRDGRIG